MCAQGANTCSCFHRVVRGQRDHIQELSVSLPLILSWHMRHCVFFLISFWLEFLKRSRVREKEVPHRGSGKKHPCKLIRVPHGSFCTTPERVRWCCQHGEHGVGAGGGLPLCGWTPSFSSYSEADLRTESSISLSKTQIIKLESPLSASPPPNASSTSLWLMPKMSNNVRFSSLGSSVDI